MNDDGRQCLRVLYAGILGLLLFLDVARFAYTPLLPMMREHAGLGVVAGGWLAAPAITGWLAAQDGSYAHGLCLAAGVMVIGTVLLVLLKLTERNDLRQPPTPA